VNRVVFVCALALLLPVPAAQAKGKRKRSGGALSQVVGGLSSSKSDKKDRGSGNNHRTRDRRSKSDDSDSDDSWDDDVDYDAVFDAGASLVTGGAFLGVRAPSGKTDVDVATNFQLVTNSDFAVGSTVRASFETFTISAAYTMYIEDQPMGDPLAFTMWRIGGGYRMVAPGLGELSFDGGPTGAHAPGLTMAGLFAGISGRLGIANAFGVDSAVRGYQYVDGARAIELEAGVRLSLIRAAYKWTKFDVGPALKGPELGIALTF